jgi:membrane protein
MSVFTNIRTIINRSAPVVFLVNKSKRIIPPGFNGIPLYDVIRFFSRQVQTTSITERASSIAFNFVMAIPAAFMFLFTLIPYFPISTELENALYSLIRDVIPGEKDNAVVINFLHDFIRKPRTGLLSLGFILALYFSSNAVIGIMLSFDKNYHGFRKRTGFQKRMVAFKLTLILYVLIFACILLLVAQGAVLRWLGIENPTVRAIIINARWLVIILLFFTTVSFIYRHAPAVQKKWKLINPGAILAAFLMIVCTMGFSYWVNNYAFYNKIYGSIGTILIVMLLIYFYSLVLLIGFELNVSISSLKKIADERKDNMADGNENPV